MTTPQTSGARSTQLSPWARTAAFGFALVGVTLLVASAHHLVVGALDGPVLVLPVVGIAALVAASYARTGGRRALGGAAVFGVLVLLGNLGHLADTLVLFTSPWDFVPNLAAAVGLALSIPAAIAARTRRDTSAASQRRLRVAALTLVGIGAIGSVGAALVSDAPTLPYDATIVDTVSNAYDPGAIQATAGDVIGVHNRDAYGHTFTVDGLGIDVAVTGGATATVDVPAGAAPGTYPVICMLHPEIMEATLTIAE